MVQVAPPVGMSDDDLEGLGFFKRIRKSLPRPKTALMMATLGPAALLHKGTRKDLGQFMRTKQGALAMAALAPIGAPAMLMTKQGRSMLPGFNKFANSKAGALALGLATPVGLPAMLLTKQGRNMLPGFNKVTGMFGGKGGGGGAEEEAPVEPMPDPGQIPPMDPSQIQYETGPYLPPHMQAEMKPWNMPGWQSPPFVAPATPPPIQQMPLGPAVPYQSEAQPMTEQPVWPGGYDPSATIGPVSPDAGPLAYDPTMGLYQPEAAPDPAMQPEAYADTPPDAQAYG
jgi:hypothetical protein